MVAPHHTRTRTTPRRGERARERDATRRQCVARTGRDSPLLSPSRWPGLVGSWWFCDEGRERPKVTCLHRRFRCGLEAARWDGRALVLESIFPPLYHRDFLFVIPVQLDKLKLYVYQFGRRFRFSPLARYQCLDVSKPEEDQADRIRIDPRFECFLLEAIFQEDDFHQLSTVP